ncbi:glutamate--cysteine ligase [Actinoplanes sp. NBRC 103695]|uniref:carboxylate-amine ligase n=1 Tax=Actinoplanes sp. NBRC 103695 TaxID=3032202 RepID=UPI0024A06CF7|nr:glutamate--cysteine ligase [Actinoplanes sp. NBRC 103695]GLY98907.1 putative glutamate--cysteine ligase 2 [Actinoplanes sp. NBRC 103695]
MSDATTISDAMAEEAESRDLLTLGLEEEYLLVEAVEPHAAEAVEDVFDVLPDDIRESVQHELQQSQIEVASPPQLELSGLHTAMRALRTGVAAAAEQAGVRLIAVGSAPAAGAPTRVVDKPRYHRMRERFGDLSPGQGMNGMHVHVSVPDPETGVQVLNHLRPWLPVLQAATTNSPLSDGADTGYASWRSMMWERWPTVGPTPYLHSHEQYQELVAAVQATGAMLDEGMLYWYARLAVNYPTVELRMGDVCPTLDDALLLAALARGLVATFVRRVADGIVAPDIPHALLSAAHWRAAHDGLEGLAIDPVSRQVRPAWARLRDLYELAEPELRRHGDLEMVNVLMARLRSHGTGAARQRAVLAGGGSVGDVVNWLAAATRG